MIARTIKISNFPEVRALNTAALSTEGDIKVMDCNGSVANPKSILGLMSLVYHSPVTISGPDEEVKWILSQIEDEGYLDVLFNKLNK